MWGEGGESIRRWWGGGGGGGREYNETVHRIQRCL